MKILRFEEVNAENIRSLRWDEQSPEEMKEAYALASAAFTAEDLQQFTELDKGTPVDQFLRELEEIQKQHSGKQTP